jgi:ribosomal protein S18 acetylase RimI-like enzyme
VTDRVESLSDQLDVDALRQALEDRLIAFNVETTGIDDAVELAYAVRDEHGELIAGLYGWTWGGTCQIDSLWVAAGHRTDGFGSDLLTRAEAEARARGCHQMLVETHSFQAPDFYPRFGFEVVTVVEGYPTGHQNVLLRKRL